MDECDVGYVSGAILDTSVGDGWLICAINFSQIKSLMKNLIHLKLFQVLFYLLFTLSGIHAQGSWSQLGFDIDGEAAGDESGYSVSLSSDGRMAAIGGY